MVGIISNFAAAATQKNLDKANEGVTASISRLSSGNKITSAKDDVAGLAVGTILKTSISTLNAAVTNAAQATSMLGVMDGALENVSNILARQKSLASQATSGSLDATARGYLNQEFQNLANEIDRIANNTDFNGIKLIDGSLSNSLTLANPAASTGYSTAFTGTHTDVSTIAFGTGFDDKALIGAMPTLKASFIAANNVQYSMTIGTKTYTATIADTTSNTSIALAYEGSSTDTLSLTVATQGAMANIAAMNTNLAKLNTDLAKATVSQTRAVSTFVGAGTLAGSTLKMTDDSDFNTLSFSDITVAEVSGQYKVSIEAMGKTYTATTTGSGDLGDASGVTTFTSTANANDTLTFTKGSSQYNIAGKTEQFIKDFKASLAGATGAVDFQVGTETTNKIAISANSVKTTNIYKDSTGAAKTLDITTQSNATTAGDVLDNAINSVIAARADIGALQSRFGYASDNLTSTIENLDAARSVFLDTNVSTESTELAKKQIQVQASISMLAKANSTLEKLAELLR